MYTSRSFLCHHCHFIRMQKSTVVEAFVFISSSSHYSASCVHLLLSVWRRDSPASNLNSALHTCNFKQVTYPPPCLRLLTWKVGMLPPPSLDCVRLKCKSFRTLLHSQHKLCMLAYLCYQMPSSPFFFSIFEDCSKFWNSWESSPSPDFKYHSHTGSCQIHVFDLDLPTKLQIHISTEHSPSLTGPTRQPSYNVRACTPVPPPTQALPPLSFLLVR